MTANATLKSLRDKPFELLRELERLARIALTGQGRDAGSEREWVGVAFRLSAENFLVAREETREVLGLPAVVTRVPGSKAWIRGVANVRGQLLPVVDLRAFLGGGATNTNRSTRVLVAHHREVPAGLLVDEVLGFRRFNEDEFSGAPPPTIARCERYLAGAFRRGTESWPVFSLRTLLESPEFLQAAAS
jgi:twitching motility protein PilI